MYGYLICANETKTAIACYAIYWFENLPIPSEEKLMIVKRGGFDRIAPTPLLNGPKVKEGAID